MLCLLSLSTPASQVENRWLPLGEVPRGLWLPVTLMRTISAGKAKAGSPVILELTQPVPAGANRVLDAHARILGTVVRSEDSATAAGQSTLQMRFTSLELGKDNRPAVFAVRAIATYAEVAETAAPVSAPADRGNPSAANWTTRQIGGDEVYRAGWAGDVYNRTMQKVGSADFHGVYSQPVPLPGSSAMLARAVGPFSTSARGLYGFGDETHMTSDSGVLTLCSPKHLALHGGDALLLEVTGFPGE